MSTQDPTLSEIIDVWTKQAAAEELSDQQLSYVLREVRTRHSPPARPGRKEPGWDRAAQLELYAYVYSKLAGRCPSHLSEGEEGGRDALLLRLMFETCLSTDAIVRLGIRDFSTDPVAVTWDSEAHPIAPGLMEDVFSLYGADTKFIFASQMTGHISKRRAQQIAQSFVVDWGKISQPLQPATMLAGKIALLSAIGMEEAQIYEVVGVEPAILEARGLWPPAEIDVDAEPFWGELHPSWTIYAPSQQQAGPTKNPRTD